MAVYFISAGDPHPIKIGVASDVAARLIQLQGGNWLRLQIVGVIEGDATLEKAVHRRLKSYRVSGEWYARTAEVENVVTLLIGGDLRTALGVESIASPVTGLRLRFKEACDAAGSASEVARQLGCTRQMISAIVRGRAKPGRSMANAIQLLLGIPASAWDEIEQIASHSRPNVI